MNKKTLAIVLAIALAIGAFAGLSFNLFSANAETTYVGDGTELIYEGTDGGTEANKVARIKQGTANKTLWDAAKSNHSRSVTMADHGGNNLAFPAEARTSEGNRVYFEMATTTAGRYIFSAWIYFEGTGTHEIELSFATGLPSADASARKKVSVTAGAWTQISIVSDELAAETNAAPGIWSTASVPKFYLDDLSVQKAVASTPAVTAAPEYVGDGTELVYEGTDGGTEANKVARIKQGTANKTLWDSAKSNHSRSVTMADHSGNNLAFPAEARTSEGNRVYFEMATTTAGRYIFSAWIYFEGTGTHEIELSFATGLPSVDASARKKVSVTAGAWTQISIVSDELAAETNAAPGIWTTASVPKFYLDDLSVQKAVLASSITPSPTAMATTSVTASPTATATATATATPAPVVLPQTDGVELVSLASNNTPKLGGNALYNSFGITYADEANDHNNDGKIWIIPTNNSWSNRMYWAKASMEAGKYLFSMWVKFPNATGEVELDVYFSADRSQENARGEVYPATDAKYKVDIVTIPANEWTRITYVTDEIPAGKIMFGFNSRGDAGSQIFWLDDVSVQKVVTSSGNNSGGSSAGSSNTGDVVPVVLIAVALISASTLVLVARRKREE